MTEPRSPIRALVASFLFTDLVGFSKGTVAEQYAAKSALSTILRDNLALLQTSEYRVKDTGDGALIIFLASPEHALYMALAITQDFARASPTPGVSSKSLRTGINVGPVKEQLDLEARPNYVGDGINDAKRIMDFAEPGQIAASRSFYDSVACLDSMYAELFSHIGAPGDKHGRIHELYGVKSDPAVLQKLKLDLATASPEPASTPKAPSSRTATRKAQPNVANDSAVASNDARSAGRKWATRAIAPVVLAAFAAAWFLGRDPIAPEARRSLPAAETPPAGSTGSDLPARPATGNPASASASTEAPPTAPPEAAADAPAAKSATRSQPDIANADRATENAKGKPVPAPVAALPAANAAASNSKPRSPAPPAVSTPAPAVSGDQGAARCRRIIEKAELGEPLSQEEKKELVNSCR